jgi:hypothetical protein
MRIVGPQRIFALVLIALCWMNVLGLPRMIVCSAQEVTLKVVEGAWKRREASFQNFEVRWTRNLERHIPVSEKDNHPFKEVPVSAKLIARGELRGKLVIAGDRLRWESQRPAIIPGNPSFAGAARIEVWDGKQGRVMKENRSPGMPPWWTGGTHRDRILGRLSGDSQVQPIVDHFRPMLRMARILKEAKLQPKSESIEDKTCVIFTSTKVHDGRNHSTEVWVCPAEDFAVRRIVSRINDVLFTTSDLTYRLQAADVVVLDSWKRVIYSEGIRERLDEGKVTFCAVNPELPKDAFSLAIPIDPPPVKAAE